MKVGDVIGKTLSAYGAEYFFTFTGGDQDLWIGLRDAGIRSVLARSERSAVYMADAYARITGKPSFTYGQYGPGATFVVSGLTDAYWANSPVIAITSATNSRTKYRAEYQEVEQQALYSSITKWNAYVPMPERMADMLRTAIRVAVSGVPGPVHLDVPSEMIFFGRDLADTPEIYAEPMFTKVPAYRVAPPAAAIEEAARAIAAAKRPMLLAGGGVVASEAWDELVELAEYLDIPVVTSMAGKGSIPETHPLSVGVVGRYSRKVANDVVSECDTYIAIGSRLGGLVTDTFKVPPQGTRIIHMDLDPTVLGRNYREDVSIVSDAKVGLRALLDAAKASNLRRYSERWADWTSSVKGRVQRWREKFKELARQPILEGKLSPYFVLGLLNEVLKPGDTVVADTGYMAAWAGALAEMKAAGKGYIRTAGSLGWAFPASLGASLATAGRGRVFCIIGDGGVGYHLGDFETALRLHLPVIVVVLNNSSLAFEYHIQKHLYGEGYICPEVNDYLEVDYAAVARAFGAFGERVSDPAKLRGALLSAIESGRPALIDVPVSREIPAPVTYYERVMERVL